MFDYIREAVHGPGSLRFIIQPLLAVVLGIRDGRQDAKNGRTPFILRLVTGKGQRKEILREGVRQILVPLCVGFSLDVVLRLSMGFGFHPLSSALVGGVLVGLPYCISRGIANRAAGGRRRE